MTPNPRVAESVRSRHIEIDKATNVYGGRHFSPGGQYAPNYPSLNKSADRNTNPPD